MRAYELVFIVHPDLDDSALKELVDRVKGWITDAGGQVAKVDLWGKRKLAYRLRKQSEGQYVLMKTQMAPSFCTQLERNLRLQEPVLRFLLAAE
ncbi:MAG: 30S ribosomal protein S6 [Chloroflexi bacterium RBG_19FT_COMBO_50_10]|nr:MAG: 30S ribosomal protein S6 [Chloroflexi bacterium RBG_19FT_COMBO_50_10]HLE52624.1 30S ribosomal protein S6 [Anaerolineales bacterium]